MERISVLGLGRLGLPYAACLAEAGFEVWGADINQDKIMRFKSGDFSDMFISGLENVQELKDIHWTTDTVDAIKNTDVSFIIVSTPTDEQGRFSIKYVLDVCKDLGTALQNKKSNHLIILVSTVMPGDITNNIIPYIDYLTGGSFQEGSRCYGFVYAPEFLGLGEELQDIRNPRYIILGGSQPDATQALKIYSRLHYHSSVHPQIAMLSFTESELAKLAINAYVATKITFANYLQTMCELLDDTNVDNVTAAMGMDNRIGARYLKGGNRAGGPCYPRDIRALESLAKSLAMPTDFPRVIRLQNDRTTKRLYHMIRNIWNPRTQTLGILGLSYKANTDSIAESTSVDLLDIILGSDSPKEIVVYDPIEMAVNRMRSLFGHALTYTESTQECIEKADVVVLVNTDLEFFGIETMLENKTVIDCWRVLNRERLPDSCRYFAVGVSNASAVGGIW